MKKITKEPYLEIKRTWQTETNDGGSERAADGNINPDWNANSCMMTNNVDHPWWACQFEGGTRKVDRVEVYVRNSDCKL